MTTFIQDSIADGSLVLWHDYRAGHMIDLSGNGNDGTPTSVIWQGRDGIRFPTTGSWVQVADSSELQLTTGTLAVLAAFMDQATINTERLISKRDGGGNNYDWYLEATDINLYDGATISDVNVTVPGHRLFAVSFDTTNQPDGYRNGIFHAQYDNIMSTLAVNDAPLFIGNRYTGTYQFQSAMQAVLIFNDKLTATEHAQLYSELHENGGPS